MGGYVLNFMVYTLAMSGLIFFALFVYKKVTGGGFKSGGSKMLSIEEVMNINPRKSLMIVNAGAERFLVASDIDKTTLISKLEDSGMPYSKASHSRFENIPEETTEKIADIMKENNQKQDALYSGDNPKTMQNVHLEVIRGKNKASGRQTSYTSRGKRTGQTVNIEVGGKIKSRGQTPMKEMARKVNKL